MGLEIPYDDESATYGYRLVLSYNDLLSDIYIHFAQISKGNYTSRGLYPVLNLRIQRQNHHHQCLLSTETGRFICSLPLKYQNNDYTRIYEVSDLSSLDPLIDDPELPQTVSLLFLHVAKLEIWRLDYLLI